MPLPDFTQLQVQPDLLIDWMQTNLLIARVLNNNGLGAQWLTIVPFVHPIYGACTAQDTTGAAMDVYEVVSAGAHAANGLRSYICNYTPGAVENEVIDAHADYCFTTAMNGCSFAMSPAVGGQVTVAHANDPGGPTSQRTQLSTAVGPLTANHTVLEPAAYRRLRPQAGLTATTVAVRMGGTWSLYFQSFESMGGGTYLCYGAMKV